MASGAHGLMQVSVGFQEKILIRDVLGGMVGLAFGESLINIVLLLYCGISIVIGIDRMRAGGLTQKTIDLDSVKALIDLGMRHGQESEDHAGKHHK